MKFLLSIVCVCALGLSSCGISDVTDIEGHVENFVGEKEPTRAEVTVVNTHSENLNYVWTGRIDSGTGNILGYNSGIIQIKPQEQGETIELIFIWTDASFTTVPVYVKAGHAFTIHVAPDPISVTKL